MGGLEDSFNNEPDDSSEELDLDDELVDAWRFLNDRTANSNLLDYLSIFCSDDGDDVSSSTFHAEEFREKYFPDNTSMNHLELKEKYLSMLDLEGEKASRRVLLRNVRLARNKLESFRPKHPAISLVTDKGRVADLKQFKVYFELYTDAQIKKLPEYDPRYFEAALLNHYIGWVEKFITSKISPDITTRKAL